MLVAQSRPRNLKWYHAGPLLFGDWGTSRLYVLGLAFYYTAHASVLYLSVMALIMAAVAWAYTIVCRCFPEGGGVYAAARKINPTLAVIGATLLLCDYIVTAALSAIEAFHYFGVPHELVVWLSIGTIGLVGIINWLGSRSAGTMALWIAVLAIIASAMVAVLCLPYLGKGLSTVTTGHESLQSPWERWESLVRIVLALSGLEAVANMTGLMTHPVQRTSRRTIWPVLLEVVALNLIFGIALNALPSLHHQVKPDYVTYEIDQGLAPENVPPEVKEYRDTALKVIATHNATEALGATAGKAFGMITGIVFGMLLLSAVNTAIMAMVSVKYSLAQDKELPHALTKLNYSGVPWIGLIIACMLPATLLALEADVKALGELYAIGVVGAITINILSCAYNRELDIKRWERSGLWALGVLMFLIEATIVVAKPHAAIFAGGDDHRRPHRPLDPALLQPQAGAPPGGTRIGMARASAHRSGRGRGQRPADHARRPRPGSGRVRGGTGPQTPRDALCRLRPHTPPPGHRPGADPPDRGRQGGPGVARLDGAPGQAERRGVRSDLRLQPGRRRGDPRLHGHVRVRHAHHGQVAPLRLCPKGRR
jgi:amino acid transporter